MISEPGIGWGLVAVTERRTATDEAFPPARARRIAEWLEVHPTPKHGRGLTRAESELSVLAKQGLDRRIGTRGELPRERAAWEGERNGRGVVIQWQVTTIDAHIKLRRLYPTLQ
jgi:hypothetical protein